MALVLKIIRDDGRAKTVIIQPGPAGNVFERIREALREAQTENANQTTPDDSDPDPDPAA